MIPIAFSMHGQEEVVVRFRDKGARVRLAILKEMRAIGRELAAQARALAPRSSGKDKERYPWHLADEIRSRTAINTPEIIKIEIRPSRRRAFWGLFMEQGVHTTTKTPREYVRRIGRAGAPSPLKFYGRRSLSTRTQFMAFREGKASRPVVAGTGLQYVANTRGRRIDIDAHPFMGPARRQAEARYTARIQAAITQAMAGGTL